MEKHRVIPEHAEKFRLWLKERGGLALWRSVDLSDPALTWTTPANDVTGNPTTKPHWKADTQPYRVITDPSEVEVVVPKEVKRFHVAIRLGSQGMKYTLTDGGSNRLRKELAKVKDSWYAFDYYSQDAVIYAPDKQVPLIEWIEKEQHAAL